MDMLIAAKCDIEAKDKVRRRMQLLAVYGSVKIFLRNKE